MADPGAITARTALAFLLATWPRRVLAAVLLFVPVIVGAAGGLGSANPPARTGAPDEVTDTGVYHAVPRSYFVSDQVDAGSLEDGERWVGAIVQLTNQGTEPISVAFSDPTFELPDEVPNDSFVNPHEVLRLDTGARLGSAQPGVTYEAVLLWRTTGLEDPPAELTLTMRETAWQLWNIEAGYWSWRATPETIDVVLPRTEAPADILEEDEDE